MKTWIPGLLFSSRPLKFEEFAEFLDDYRIGLIVDFRERDPWYREKFSKNIEIIHLWIKPNEVILDVGRALKDKHTQMKKFCQKIVLDFLVEKQTPVLFICNDGFVSSGYLALVCRYWYFLHKGEGEEKKDFIKENKEKEKDFRSCKSKPQIEQVLEIAKYAREISRWFGFNKK